MSAAPVVDARRRIILRAGRDHAQLDYKGPGPKPLPAQNTQPQPPAVAAVPTTKPRSE